MAAAVLVDRLTPLPNRTPLACCCARGGATACSYRRRTRSTRASAPLRLVVHLHSGDGTELATPARITLSGKWLQAPVEESLLLPAIRRAQRAGCLSTDSPATYASVHLGGAPLLDLQSRIGALLSAQHTAAAAAAAVSSSSSAEAAARVHLVVHLSSPTGPSATAIATASKSLLALLNNNGPGVNLGSATMYDGALGQLDPAHEAALPPRAVSFLRSLHRLVASTPTGMYTWTDKQIGR